MHIDILTLFPDMFISPFNESIIGRAVQNRLLQINTVNIRDFALDKHRQADDYPFGGGAGMVMKADVLIRSIRSVKGTSGRVLYLSPQGRRLDQPTVRRLSAEEHLVLLCGHYEGIDARAMTLVDEELSIGDYVLTGGELGAMVVVDAVARLIPGVLGDDESAQDESFTDGLLEYPQYTRPRSFEDLEVPPVLLSGHHEEIRRWRQKMSLQATLLKRPDLLLERDYDPEERKLLEEILFVRKKEDGAQS
jgi:tRNA (guanine37-N1)-methyltransferase